MIFYCEYRANLMRIVISEHIPLITPPLRTMLARAMKRELRPNFHIS